MRLSQYLMPTFKETPAEAELISHRLMLRSGMIRKLASGLYTWLPLGLRVLRKVERVIREEMQAVGAQEMLMPSVQPAELWQETGRWDKFGSELLKIEDRHHRAFCFAPTHEEVVTDIARACIRSYKQLPLTTYQIQSKFRDEIRPRFGVMRAREFMMKDAYSFHLDKACLENTYQQMFDAYTRIFTRLGLRFRAVMADTGSIGGDASHEFHVLADSGEDAIAYCPNSDYAANVELASSKTLEKNRPPASVEMLCVDTPGQYTITEVSTFLKRPAQSTLKTLLVKGDEAHSFVVLVLQGHDELNELKAAKLPGIAAPLQMATDAEIIKTIGCKPGSIGPVGLSMRVIADHATYNLHDFVCGANMDDKHWVNVNWGRDLPEPEFADLRQVSAGDESPDGCGPLSIMRGIEVGHIFQLGDGYSRSMKAHVLNESGKGIPMQMGCYGAGVSRIVAAAIEQHHDEAGIAWPREMAPFQISLIPINLHKSLRLRQASDALFNKLTEAGYDVLFDDRNERPGAMFVTSELIGVPYRLVLSERSLDTGTIEFCERCNKDSQVDLALDTLLDELKLRIDV